MTSTRPAPTHDQAAIADIVRRVGAAADAHRWRELRALLADPVVIDYGAPEALEPAQVLARWRPLFDALDGTQHVILSSDVAVDGDRAHAESRFQATHVLRGAEGGDVWTLEGRYEHDLERRAGRWMVTRMRMVPGTSTGNARLPELALARAAATLRPGRNRVTFDSGGDTLVGRLHLPSTYRDGDRLPMIVVTGPWTTVKEQVADAYAARLAAAGFAALTFDFRGFGESGGAPRQWESPARKVADLRRAADVVRTLPVTDGDRVGVLGICFGAGYAASAIVEGARYRSLATVAAWLHDPPSLVQAFGEEEIARRYRVGREAAAEYARAGTVTYVPAASTTDRTAAMFGLDYYADEARGVMPEWTNRFAVMSWPEWLDFDAVSLAPRVRVPTLVVHSDGSALPDNARRFHDALGGEHALLWLEGFHTDFYDRAPKVEQAAAAVVEHFGRTLGT